MSLTNGNFLGVNGPKMLFEVLGLPTDREIVNAGEGNPLTPSYTPLKRIVGQEDEDGEYGEGGADSWSSVAPDLNNQDIMSDIIELESEIYGCTIKSSVGGRLHKWNGVDAWIQVAGTFGSEVYITKIVVLDGKIYGGSYPNSKLLEWNGVDAWTEVAPKYGSETQILSMIVYGDEIYASTWPNGLLLKWNGVDAWGLQASQYSSEVPWVLIEFNSEIYGGSYGGTLLKWNEVDAWTLAALKFESENWIYALAEHNSKLYAGTGPNGLLLEWDEISAWTQVAPKFLTEVSIKSLISYQEELYGGTGTNGKLLKWDETSAWEEVADQYASEVSLNALLEVDNTLYGCTSSNANLLMWNGSKSYTPPFADTFGYISNFEPYSATEDMCGYIDSDKEVILGIADREDILGKDYPIKTIINTGIFVRNSPASQCVLLFTWGGVIQVVICDYGRDAATTINHYTVVNDALALVVNIYTNTLFEGTYDEAVPQLGGAPCYSVNGSVYFSMMVPKHVSAIWYSTIPYAYVMKWDGLFWYTQLGVNYHAFERISQVCELPDESKYVEFSYLHGESRLWKSITDNVWLLGSEDFDSTLFSTVAADNLWYSSYYYDSVTDAAYRAVAGLYIGCYLYKLDSPTKDNFLIPGSWEPIMYLYSNKNSPPSIYVLDENLYVQWSDQAGRTVVCGFVSEFDVNAFQPENVALSFARESAGSFNVTLPNKAGILAPDGDGNYSLWPNNEIRIRLYLNQAVIKDYYGYIDKVNMTTYPQRISVSGRDFQKRILDQSFEEEKVFVSQKAEDIFSWLALAAGLKLGTIESTNIVLTITLDPTTYASAMSQIVSYAKMEYEVNGEYVNFQLPANKKPIKTETLVLAGPVSLSEVPVLNEEIVTYLGTVCTRDWSYELDYNYDTDVYLVSRLETGIIPLGGEVIITYIYAKHTFREGVDIFNLSYTVSDDGVYTKITGKATIDEVEESYSKTPTNTFNTLPLKTNTLDLEGKVTTYAGLVEYVNKYAREMHIQAREVSFSAVPADVSIGDSVRIIENSSTISEIYKITSLSYNSNSKTAMMSVTAHYFGAAYNP